MAKRNPKPSADRSLWERQRDAIRAAKAAGAPAAPRYTFPDQMEPAPVPAEPAPGTYRIDQLRMDQCRYPCTPFSARSHRFCGQPTEIGPGNRWGSWCAEHLVVVTAMPGRTPGGASKADLSAKTAEDAA